MTRTLFSFFIGLVLTNWHTEQGVNAFITNVSFSAQECLYWQFDWKSKIRDSALTFATSQLFDYEWPISVIQLWRTFLVKTHWYLSMQTLHKINYWFVRGQRSRILPFLWHTGSAGDRGLHQVRLLAPQWAPSHSKEGKTRKFLEVGKKNCPGCLYCLWWHAFLLHCPFSTFPKTLTEIHCSQYLVYYQRERWRRDENISTKTAEG